MYLYWGSQTTSAAVRRPITLYGGLSPRFALRPKLLDKAIRYQTSFGVNMYRRKRECNSGKGSVKTPCVLGDLFRQMRVKHYPRRTRCDTYIRSHGGTMQFAEVVEYVRIRTLGQELVLRAIVRARMLCKLVLRNLLMEAPVKATNGAS